MACNATDGNLTPEEGTSPTGAGITGMQGTPGLRIPHLTEVRVMAEKMPSTDAARIVVTMEESENGTVSDVERETRPLCARHHGGGNLTLDELGGAGKIGGRSRQADKLHGECTKQCNGFGQK